MIRFVGLAGLLTCLGPITLRADDPSALNLADLAAYRAALTPPTNSTLTPVVSFRDLWDHPERFQGQSVAVVGRLARLFRQPGVGQFRMLFQISFCHLWRRKHENC